jgi:putative transposase
VRTRTGAGGTGGMRAPSVRPEGAGGFSGRGYWARWTVCGREMSHPSRSVCGMSERRFRRNRGGVCSLGLHLVSCQEYRGRILGGRVAARGGELLEQIAGGHGGEIVATEVAPDHGHVFVRVGPTDARCRWCGRSRAAPHGCWVPSSVVLRRFATVLWFPLYVAASVGCVWESMVRRYIGHQSDAVAS